MKAKETLAAIHNIAKGLQQSIEQNKQGALTNTPPNGKQGRTYNQNEAVEATNSHKRQINSICEELGIDAEKNGKWQITLDDVQAIRAHLGFLPFQRKKNQKLQVYTVSSLKGGGGKTTSVVNISTGLATEPMTQYKIGVIDLDPQGTSTSYFKPNLSEDDFTVGDLLVADFELEEGETFEQVCIDSFLSTNASNIKILPTKGGDRRYEVEVERRKLEANKKGEQYIAYHDLENVINAVKDEFDIIFIDTPPQFSTSVLSAHYVATSLIIPIHPDENDRDASGEYTSFLEEVYQMLIGLGHKGYDHVKVLLSNVKSNSLTQKSIINEIRSELRSNCFLTHFSEREAVRNCASKYHSIFEVSGSDYTNKETFNGTRKTLLSAQQEFGLVIAELENDVLTTWGVNNG